MALVKTDYGLIYNDDGSLCVTVRDDDIPFEGVKSFAVEEGTTNLITGDSATFATSIGSWVESDANLTITWENIYNEFLKQNGVMRYRKTDSNNASCRINITDSTLTTYSGSIYIKLISGNINAIRPAGVFYYSDNTWTDYSWVDANGSYKRIIDMGNGIYRIEVNNMKYDQTKIDAGLTISKFQIRITSPDLVDFYVLAAQWEQKPFATSFVDGTRADGNLQLPWTMDGYNFVINLFAKDLFSSTNTNTHIFNLGTTGLTDVYDGRLILRQNNSLFQLYIDPADGSASVSSNTSVASNDGKYHMLTVLVEATQARLYIDGIYKTTLTYDFTKENFDKLVLGSNISFSPVTAYGLISNLYIGNYDPNIWTDAFIQELYNAKRPFSVPAKLPII
ncbi:hypothetical protein X275_01385 [Marinitoga sp. 1197]|uniref:phage head spike fiber domain-containing protein n=1 Tax=Marinitoga sp. 1197 TaxID=1428449 RepID=UPI00064106E1|nr:hypothetical protein [Marinitoga sp. 1197]AJW76924.1 hypothetical protein UF08_35 [Marinitoga camini virus 1]KLO24068.1 hypothetical protein X275_01385 [Marinitoga sp. 1197]